MNSPNGFFSNRPRHISQLLARPPFYAANVFELGAFAAHSLLQLSRLSHPYGFTFHALGSAPHLHEFEAGADFDSVMRGDGFDFGTPSLAATRAVFETLERVWSAFIPRERLVTSTAAELGPRAVDPRSFALLSAEELAATGGRFVSYHSELRLDWIEVQRIEPSGALAEAMVPALLVFPGFGVRFPAQRFVPMLSTGLAAATRYDDALLHVICEVIERDAFATAWLLRLSPPRIGAAADVLPPETRTAVERLMADGFTMGFYDLTRDIDVPVVLAVIRSSRDGADEAPTLGLGCHPRPAEALSKAMREAMLRLISDYDFFPGTDFKRKPLAQNCPQGRSEALREFLSSQNISDRIWKDRAEHSGATQMPELLLRVLDTVLAAGHEVYLCDLTPEVAGRDQRFVLLRALVSGLQPHLYEPDCWRLASPRLAAIARQLELNGGVVRPTHIQQEINPFAWHVQS